MLIDWFTVVAQIINFLILVLLLRRFLYRPILKTIQEREESIKARLEDAQQAEIQARKLIEDYEIKNHAWAEEKEAILHQAKEEAEAVRKQLLRKARQEAEHHQTLWQQAINQEKEIFLDELRLRISQQTYKIARQALIDLADVELEDHITRVFITRLRALDREKVSTMKSLLNGTDQPVIISSAFKIPQNRQEQLEETLHTWGLNNQPLGYELVPELLAGIELKIPGQKLSWNLSEYLETLEESIFAGLLEPGGQKENAG